MKIFLRYHLQSESGNKLAEPVNRLLAPNPENHWCSGLVWKWQ